MALTRAFTDTRDLVGADDHLPKPERPAFHELRVLGAHLMSSILGQARDQKLLSDEHSAWMAP